MKGRDCLVPGKGFFYAAPTELMDCLFVHSATKISSLRDFLQISLSAITKASKISLGAKVSSLGTVSKSGWQQLQRIRSSGTVSQQ